MIDLHLRWPNPVLDTEKVPAPPHVMGLALNEPTTRFTSLAGELGPLLPNPAQL